HFPGLRHQPPLSLQTNTRKTNAGQANARQANATKTNTRKAGRYAMRVLVTLHVYTTQSG
ncbi:MAG: hypothetical protein ACO3SW_05390, partial [Candidatus Puniceispirillaceae bacterium]